MDIGDRIAGLRKQAGLTQEQLADRLFVSRELVSKWEQGTRMPGYREAGELAKTLGVEISEIVDEEDYIIEELAKCIPADAETKDLDVVSLLNAFLPKQRPTARRMFVRRYHFHESTAEISRMFGTSEAYVRTSLYRTRRRLKRFLNDAKTVRSGRKNEADKVKTEGEGTKYE